MATYSLDGKWMFRVAGALKGSAPKIAKLDAWMPVLMPGTLHYALQKLKKTPDAFYSRNELDLQWIDEQDWEIRRKISVPGPDCGKLRQQLVFDGIDTVADHPTSDPTDLGARATLRRHGVALGSHRVVRVPPHEQVDEGDDQNDPAGSGVQLDPRLHGGDHLEGDHDDVDDAVHTPIEHTKGAERTGRDGCVEHDDPADDARHQGRGALQTGRDHRSAEDVLDDLMHPERTLRHAGHRPGAYR